MRSRILIADSEPVYRQRCRDALRAAGYSVICAASRDEVVRKAGEACPELVVLDLRLDGGGAEALGEILEGGATPLVILTSRCHLADESFLVWSADDCIEKSGDISTLVAAVRRLLAVRPSPQRLLEAPRSLVTAGCEEVVPA